MNMIVYKLILHWSPLEYITVIQTRYGRLMISSGMDHSFNESLVSRSNLKEDTIFYLPIKFDTFLTFRTILMYFFAKIFQTNIGKEYI